MTDLSNSTATNYGMQAAAKWNSSQNAGDAGDALAIMALYQARTTMTFSAEVFRKGSEIAETIDFDIDEWEAPLWNKDGSKDTKAMAARTLAVASKLFGLTELTNACKQRIERAKKVALYLGARHAGQEAYADLVQMKGNKLVVPYAACIAAPGDDATDNDKAMYEAMKDKPLTLDGKGGASLAELGRRARPDTTKRPASEQKDKGASLMESIKFVHAIVLQNVGEDGESDVALSPDLRRSLYELQTTIASYFTADPIGDEIKQAA